MGNTGKEEIIVNKEAHTNGTKEQEKGQEKSKKSLSVEVTLKNGNHMSKGKEIGSSMVS